MSNEIRLALKKLAIQARIVLTSHVCGEHGCGECSDRDNLVYRIQEADRVLGESTELILDFKGDA